MRGIDLLRELVNNGLKIFNLNQAKEIGKGMGIKEKHLPDILYKLKKKNWIWAIKRGVYSITASSGFGPSPHEFEIVMALVNPCAISHWTALHYHHLTQQTPNIVYAITPKGTPIPRGETPYHFVQVGKDRFFGFKNEWVGESKVKITDPERTLLDGLNQPHYCGDFQEVLHAFKMRGADLDIEKLVGYAKRLDIATIKRLGWVLETFDIAKNLDVLKTVRTKGFRKLDASGPRKGTINKKWMLIENI